ncbi:MAG TPA: Mpo1-like protein [Planctomycetaceae bacterium]|nr:Mpo1-like protein [Planctomycetaceae bacterium]
MLGRFLKNYIERHRHPGNQLFHLVGLPVTFVLPFYFLAKGDHVWALTSFLIGYALQFIGHAIEGNDAGELIVIKKVLGKPYVEFGPRSKNSSEND